MLIHTHVYISTTVNDPSISFLLNSKAIKANWIPSHIHLISSKCQAYQNIPFSSQFVISIAHLSM